MDIANHPQRTKSVGDRTPQQFSLIIMIDADRDGLFSSDTETQNKYIVANGCYVNSLTINGAEGEYLSYSMELSVRQIDYTTYGGAGGGATDGSADTFADIYNNIASPQLCAYYVTTLATSGAFATDETKTSIKDFSLTINNNYTKIWGMSSALPLAVVAGACEITGSFTRPLDAFTEFGEIDASVNTTGTITIVITCPVFGANTIALSTVNYDSLGLDISENEPVDHAIAFTASSVVLS